MSRNLSWSIFIFLVFGLAFGLIIPNLETLVIQSGHYIGSSNLSTDYLRAIVWALTLTAVLYVCPFPKETHGILMWLWFARCLVTLGFMLFYENHYDLDAYHYFQHSMALSEPGRLKLGDGTGFITWLAWTFNHYLPFTESYHTLKVFWSFLGLVGVYFHYQTYLLVTEKHETRLLWALGLFPSMLFWSSILGKDPINFLGIALVVYGTFGLILRQKTRYFLALSIGLLLVTMVRFWLGGILVASLGIGFWVRGSLFTPKKIALAVSMVFFIGMVFNLSAEMFQVSGTDQLIERADSMSKAWGRGGSGQVAPSFKSVGDVLLFAPIGMFSAVFRPLPGEILNPFGLIAGFENVLLFFVFFLMWRKLRKTDSKDSLVVFCFTYIFIWAFIYGFISYQNLGTAARFKLQILPFILMLPFYLNHLRQRE
jgi:hypothetical protein